MTPKDIKIILIQRDLTQAALAREFKCLGEELNYCINRRRPYPRLRKKLAKRLGIPVEVLFAEEPETAAATQ